MKRITRSNWLVLPLILALFFVACKGELNRVVERTHDNGQPQWVRYYDGDPSAETFVKMEFYYPNGQIKSRTFFENNKKHGVAKSWHKNGALMSKIKYVKGKKDGQYFVNYKNGKPKYKGLYDMNKQVGDWVRFSKTGDTIAVEKYNKGNVQVIQYNKK